MKYKEGDKIFVFDGSDFGNRDYWIDKGVYEIIQCSGEVSVKVRTTMYCSDGDNANNFGFYLPINQVVHLGTNKLIEILFDTESYL